MARIIKKPGDLLRFPLSEAGHHGYCQWLADGTARVFLAATAEELTAAEILSLPVAFRVWIYKDTPGRYGWEKAGKADIPKEFSQPQRYAKKDTISGALSIYFEGVETPATAAEVKGLEIAAVWAHPHIVERLEARLAGRESMSMRSIQIEG